MTDKADLSLVPMDELQDEIFKRCNDAIIITSRFEPGGADECVPFIKTRCKEFMSTALGLIEISKTWMLTRCLKVEPEGDKDEI